MAPGPGGFGQCWPHFPEVAPGARVNMDSVSFTAPPVPYQESDAQQCAICLDDLVSDVVKTHCGHRFHHKCAVALLQEKLLEKRKCAICRQHAVPLVRESGALLYEESPLFESLPLCVCRVGDNRQLEKLVAKHPSIVHLKFPMNSDHCTLLYQASFLGHTDCMNTLIRAGADVDRVVTSENLSALHAAARNGHSSCVIALINAGANLELTTATSHSTALCLACKLGNADCVKALLAARANIEAREIDGARPLHMAALKGHSVCLVMLIKAKADLNARFADGATPLMLSVLKGNTLCTEALMVAGADPEISTQIAGLLPLRVALTMGHVDCALALIEFGAAVNTDLNYYPLLFRAVSLGSTACVQALIKHGAHLEATDGRGATALCIAIRMGFTDCVRALIKAGAQVNRVTKDGNTLVQELAQPDKVDCLQALIDARADVNRADDLGTCLLHYAAASGSAESVKMLIDAGAHLDTVGSYDARKVTALFCAATKGNTRCVEALIDAKADLDIPSDDGRTPLFAAIQHNHTESALTLISAGANVRPVKR